MLTLLSKYRRRSSKCWKWRCPSAFDWIIVWPSHQLPPKYAENFASLRALLRPQWPLILHKYSYAPANTQNRPRWHYQHGLERYIAPAPASPGFPLEAPSKFIFDPTLFRSPPMHKKRPRFCWNWNLKMQSFGHVQVTSPMYNLNMPDRCNERK